MQPLDYEGNEEMCKSLSVGTDDVAEIQNVDCKGYLGFICMKTPKIPSETPGKSSLRFVFDKQNLTFGDISF